MKYIRLTKEQLEELHLEFANFLALQNIDKPEWEALKTQKPEIAEQELDIFSDLIWEGALSKVEFLEQFSEKHLFLFQFSDQEARCLIIKSNNPSVNFMTEEGLIWVCENFDSDQLEITQGKKSFTHRNQEIFDLIQQGAIISDGKLLKQLTIGLTLDF